MGLLDIAGQVMGALGGNKDGQHGGLMEVVSGLLSNEQGGIAGLVKSFESNGLGEIINSWISNGKNLPISAEQLHAVLGSEQVQAIAQKLNFSVQDVLPHLAQLLPQIVDKLTPDGKVAEGGIGGGMLGSVLGMLSGLKKEG